MARAIWPRAKMTELLNAAVDRGAAAAICDSAEEADRFRYALHHHRRRDERWSGLSIFVEDNKVMVMTLEEPHVSIMP